MKEELRSVNIEFLIMRVPEVSVDFVEPDIRLLSLLIRKANCRKKLFFYFQTVAVEMFHFLSNYSRINPVDSP